LLITLFSPVDSADSVTSVVSVTIVVSTDFVASVSSILGVIILGGRPNKKKKILLNAQNKVII